MRTAAGHPADSGCCFQLHKAAMGYCVTAIWGRTSRRDFHARAFNPGRWQIITAGGAGIGVLDRAASAARAVCCWD